MVGLSKSVFVGLPLFGIAAVILYFYHRKKRDSDDNCDRKIRTLQIKVPNNCIGEVIGRGGENIKKVQSKTNTKINFKSPDQNEEFRVCIVSGKKEDVEAAEYMILETISTHKNYLIYEMRVPQQSCGRIIGRCGDNIRAMSKASNCAITLDRTIAPSSSTKLVTIRGTSENITLAKQLIEEKIAEDEESRNKMQRTLSARSPRPNKFRKTETQMYPVPSYEKLVPMSNDSMLQVYVSAVADPTHFWVQLISPKAVELDHLVENMTEYYNKDENRELHKLLEVSSGQIVACRVTEDDKWYRVEVCTHEPYKEIRDETLVDVFYVDYGDSAYQKLSDLCQLRADFLSLRFQAIECAMDILPISGAINDRWDEETISLFEDMVYTGRWKALSAQVVRYKPRERSNRRADSPLPCVKLYDPNGPPGVDVGQQLINNGVAKPLEEEIQNNDKELDSENALEKEVQNGNKETDNLNVHEKGIQNVDKETDNANVPEKRIQDSNKETDNANVSKKEIQNADKETNSANVLVKEIQNGNKEADNPNVSEKRIQNFDKEIDNTNVNMSKD